MPEVKFPYGKEFLSLNIPEERYAGSLVSQMHHYVAPKSPVELVNDAMANPIGTPKLSVMAEGKKKVVLIASDHTRPVPSKCIVPQMLAEIREGSPDADITILISTGCHRGTTKEELVNKFGPEIVEKEKIVVHDCDDTENLVYLGKLPSGGDLIINRLAAEADLLVAEGFIEPHFFAGFSGGRKSILPGVADAVTVMGNHCSKFIDSPYSRTGILDHNPMHEDMLAAARMAKLAYIVNVVIDEDNKTVAAFAGNFETAHRKGCDFISDYVCVKPAYADIVITTNGGYPLDQNAYQSPKGMTAGEATAKEGAVIIMLASCSDGTGGDFFYHIIADEPDIETAYQKFLATPQEKTAPDQWCSQILARIVRKYKVIFVANEDQKDMIEGLKMEYAPSLEAAYKRAREIKGEDASLTCIPNGISVVVRE